MIRASKSALFKLLRRRILSRRFPNNTVIRDAGFWDLFLSVYREGRAVITVREMHNIYRLVEQTSNVNGDIAEVGVYRGGSAKVIAEYKGDRKLHLFDTFEGMPDVDSAIDTHRTGDFKDTSLKSVQDYLSQYGDIFFHKGLFPASVSGTDVGNLTFSLVHLDVDLYGSTKSGLEFFYSRLNRGGMLLSHDYRSISCPGVRRAFDEFFREKPEPIVELWDTQCLIVKM